MLRPLPGQYRMPLDGSAPWRVVAAYVGDVVVHRAGVIDVLSIEDVAAMTLVNAAGEAVSAVSSSSGGEAKTAWWPSSEAP